ncbi:MAG: hypothetical protein LC737_06515, partial [Chloroflexi bacterium]|nr:hypothetical protein [Chloroflexota bacterium]
PRTEEITPHAARAASLLADSTSPQSLETQSRLVSDVEPMRVQSQVQRMHKPNASIAEPVAAQPVRKTATPPRAVEMGHTEVVREIGVEPLLPSLAPQPTHARDESPSQAVLTPMVDSRIEVQPIQLRDAEPFVVHPNMPLHVPTRAEVRAARADERLAQPMIRVTIGRIDVRANFPAPTSAAPEPKRTPTMTLDEYLRAQRGGAR